MHPLPEYEEKVLLLQISEGDEQAFRQLFTAYSAILLPFLLRLTKSKPVAEELLQDVFLKVWLHRDKLPEIQQLKPWVFRIASNGAFSWLRKMAVEQKALFSQKIHTQGESVEEGVETKQMVEAIRQAIVSMPPQRRKIYQLSRDAGMRPSEIADELNISVSTVKNTLTSALNDIRKYIEQAGFLLPAVLIWIVKKFF